MYYRLIENVYSSESNPYEVKLKGNDFLSIVESSAPKNQMENVSKPAATVSSDTLPAKIPNNKNIEPRSRGI